LPIRIRKKNDWTRVRRGGIAGFDQAAEGGKDVEHVEIIAGDKFRGSAFGLSTNGNADGKIGFGGQAGEDGVLVTKVKIHRIRKGFGAVAFIGGDVAIARAGGIEKDKFFRMRYGEALKKNLAHDGEDGGVGTYAEGESEDGYAGEGRRFFHDAKGVAGVFEASFEKRERLLVAHEFLGLFHPAEFDDGLFAGFAGRQASLEVVVDVEVEMGL